MISVPLRQQGGTTKRGGRAAEVATAFVQRVAPERHLPLQEQRCLQRREQWGSEESTGPQSLQWSRTESPKLQPATIYCH